MGYSDPNFAVRHEHCASVDAGGAATTEYCKFRSFQRAKLKKVHAAVTVAGTAGGHAFDIFSGTTSVGSLALGTSAAGAELSSLALNIVIEPMDQVSVKSKADIVGKAQIVYEYEVLHDAVQS